MRREEGTFETGDGLQLFRRSWLPGHKSAVVLVHGYAEHSGRYDHVARELVISGHAVHAFDLRGHGRSEGKRVYIRSIDEHVDDLTRFIASVREHHPDIPIYLLGHSMGGLIVASYLLKRQSDVAGATLSGALLKSARGLARIGQGVLSLVGRLVPKLPLSKLSSPHISHDAAVVAAYDNDPLVFRGRVPAGTVAALIRAMQAAEATPESITLPLLLLHGTADLLTDPEGSKALYDGAGSTDKTLKLYDGLYHEIFNEPEKQRVIGDVVSWLNDHARPNSPSSNR